MYTLKRYVQITIKQNSISLKRERFMRMVNFEDVTPTLKKKIWISGKQEDKICDLFDSLYLLLLSFNKLDIHYIYIIMHFSQIGTLSLQLTMYSAQNNVTLGQKIHVLYLIIVSKMTDIHKKIRCPYFLRNNTADKQHRKC